MAGLWTLVGDGLDINPGINRLSQAMDYKLSELAKGKPSAFKPIIPTAFMPVTLWRIYNIVLTDWRDAAAGLIAGFTAGAAASALSDEIDGHNEEILAAIAGLQFGAFFANLESWHRAKWIADVQRATRFNVTPLLATPTGAATLSQTRAQRRAGGVVNAARVVTVRPQGLTISPTLTGIEAKLADAVAQNASLVRSVSDDTRARIANAVFSGLQSGQSKVEVARQINRGLVMSSKRARRIAQHQVDNAAGQLTKFRSEEAGLDWFRWLHSHAVRHPRLDHLDRDGKIYRWDSVTVIPGQLPGCQCFGVPVFGPDG